MRLRDDWTASPIRRNYRAGSVSTLGRPLLTRRPSAPRDWQNDVSRRLPVMARALRAIERVSTR